MRGPEVIGVAAEGIAPRPAGARHLSESLPVRIGLTGAALALTATALLWSLVTPPRGEADGIDRTRHRT